MQNKIRGSIIYFKLITSYQLDFYDVLYLYTSEEFLNYQIYYV